MMGRKFGKKSLDGSVVMEGYMGFFPEAKQIVTHPNMWAMSSDGYNVIPTSEFPNIVQNHGYKALFETEEECARCVWHYAKKVCHNNVTLKKVTAENVRKVRYSVKMEIV